MRPLDALLSPQAHLHRGPSETVQLLPRVSALPCPPIPPWLECEKMLELVRPIASDRWIPIHSVRWDALVLMWLNQ